MNDKELEIHIALNHHDWVTPYNVGKIWRFDKIVRAWQICKVCGEYRSTNTSDYRYSASAVEASKAYDYLLDNPNTRIETNVWETRVRT